MICTRQPPGRMAKLLRSREGMAFEMYDQWQQPQGCMWVYGWHPETEDRLPGPCIFSVKQENEKVRLVPRLKNEDRKHMDAMWALLRAGRRIEELEAIEP